jgi:hypothetical protein
MTREFALRLESRLNVHVSGVFLVLCDEDGNAAVHGRSPGMGAGEFAEACLREFVSASVAPTVGGRQ